MLQQQEQSLFFLFCCPFSFRPAGALAAFGPMSGGERARQEEQQQRTVCKSGGNCTTPHSLYFHSLTHTHTERARFSLYSLSAVSRQQGAGAALTSRTGSAFTTAAMFEGESGGTEPGTTPDARNERAGEGNGSEQKRTRRRKLE